MAKETKDAFIPWLIEQGVLRFGEFRLKSGRLSPYFFNLGSVNDGSALAYLGRCYADRIEALGWEFNVLFGPAYKGIPIAVATAIALAERGRVVPVAFNRKEAKDHGEEGVFVGAEVTGRVLLVDDVLTAGTAVREAAALVTKAGAVVSGVLIALDRREKTDSGESAVTALSAELSTPIDSVANLEDVIEYLDRISAADKDQILLTEAVHAYRREYCVTRE
ncbi:MAG: orotate phosphoribosyltransferase [Pseudomonadales bacterium]|jgi:orotate phosphoribosyltransferase|nr:orotate phosphoribosyltransferase [Pseudomonadales bacterium]MDP6469433.1 orotate phosphoribosyltransferase [Pseudomonadales bacterium]MDP6827275.1 orotate phosphoribosyltransferase [Pseudomonadales bacterium]MDP6971098.1 orotate phosphoribosyltransferase [Pseudomonadales bacterium]|tara:strand:+ start:643 stop:1305 length:663 start_codon:yes stop_codon:yes gene_type:complete